MGGERFFGPPPLFKNEGGIFTHFPKSWCAFFLFPPHNGGGAKKYDVFWTPHHGGGTLFWGVPPPHDGGGTLPNLAPQAKNFRFLPPFSQILGDIFFAVRIIQNRGVHSEKVFPPIMGGNGTYE